MENEKTGRLAFHVYFWKQIMEVFIWPINLELWCLGQILACPKSIQPPINSFHYSNQIQASCFTFPLNSNCGEWSVPLRNHNSWRATAATQIFCKTEITVGPGKRHVKRNAWMDTRVPISWEVLCCDKRSHCFQSSIWFPEWMRENMTGQWPFFPCPLGRLLLKMEAPFSVDERNGSHTTHKWEISHINEAAILCTPSWE